MKKFKLISIILAFLTIYGCGATTKLYEGPEKDKKNVAVLYRGLIVVQKEGDTDVGGELFALKIGSRETGSSESKFALLPGKYEITAQYKSSNCTILPGCGKPWTIVNYKMTVPMKNGQTYTLYPADTNHPPKKVCVYEEAHDAKGASTNVTGQFRKASNDANEIACSSAI